MFKFMQLIFLDIEYYIKVERNFMDFFSKLIFALFA